MPEQRKNLSRDKMNRLRGMPAGGFVVCDFVVCDFVVCGFVVCGTGGACDVERCGRKKSVRALKKKQAALTGGLFVSVIGVFIGGNFSGSAEMAQCWRWLNAVWQ